MQLLQNSLMGDKSKPIWSMCDVHLDKYLINSLISDRKYLIPLTSTQLKIYASTPIPIRYR